MQVLLPPDLAPGSRQLVHLTARPMVRGGEEVTQYLNNIYTLSTHYLHTIYTLSTHYLQVTRQLYLAAAMDPAPEHTAPPTCHLVSDSYTQSCSGTGNSHQRKPLS